MMLQLFLQNWRKLKKEEQARKEREHKAEEGGIHTENILRGNPLLNRTGPPQPRASFEVRQRGDDVAQKAQTIRRQTGLSVTRCDLDFTKVQGELY